MKRLTHTGLGHLFSANPVAYFFYALIAALEKAGDKRADQVRELMRDSETQTVREAYKHSK